MNFAFSLSVLLYLSFLFTFSFSQHFIATTLPYFITGSTSEIDLSTFSVQEGTIFTAKLTSTINNNEIVVSSETNVDPQGNGKILLSIPNNIAEGQYNLTISSDFGSNSSLIPVTSQSFQLLLETDKTLFQPSQTVSIFLLTSDSGPNSVTKSSYLMKEQTSHSNKVN